MDRRCPTVTGVFPPSSHETSCEQFVRKVNSCVVAQHGRHNLNGSALVVGAEISSVSCAETLNPGRLWCIRVCGEEAERELDQRHRDRTVGRNPGKSSANRGFIRVSEDARGCPQGLALQPA